MQLNNENYTLDGIGNIYIYQPKKGYRFSVDSILLFIYSPKKNIKKVLDIGAGTGICSFLFSRELPDSQITAVELQQEFSKLIKKGIEYNNFKNIKVYNKNINRIYKKFLSETFDLIISNPPYRKYGHGRLSKYKNKNFAIYDKYLKLNQLFNIVEFLLNKNGVFSFINIPSNYKKILDILENFEINIKKEIHFKNQNNKKFIIFHLVKNKIKDKKIETIKKDIWESKVNALYKGDYEFKGHYFS
ncbi:MAG TPA: methyltransferase [Candidatus Mcinerneyibacterium sp.]|nr:methyltransferase [Candidatus Mcinerneyibacterium sp.]